jgi:hypothetical protein
MLLAQIGRVAARAPRLGAAGACVGVGKLLLDARELLEPLDLFHRKFFVGHSVAYFTTGSYQTAEVSSRPLPSRAENTYAVLAVTFSCHSTSLTSRHERTAVPSR